MFSFLKASPPAPRKSGEIDAEYKKLRGRCLPVFLLVMQRTTSFVKISHLRCRISFKSMVFLKLI